jgi:hypothetical protein
MYKIKRRNSDDIAFQRLVVEIYKDIAISGGAA